MKKKNVPRLFLSFWDTFIIHFLSSNWLAILVSSIFMRSDNTYPKKCDGGVVVKDTFLRKGNCEMWKSADVYPFFGDKFIMFLFFYLETNYPFSLVPYQCVVTPQHTERGRRKWWGYRFISIRKGSQWIKKNDFVSFSLI